MNTYTRILVGLLLLAACSGDTAGPDTRVGIAANGGDAQYSTQSGVLAEPLQVVVMDPVTKEPRSGVSVTWRVSSGSGAIVSPTVSVTGDDGVAMTTATLGGSLGNYTFEATADKLVGNPATFTATAVLPPTIASITPSTANAGDTLTVTGTNFSPTADQNTVLFGGFRGRVTSATTTTLRVVVPSCLPTRSIQVTVSLGAVASPSTGVTVNAPISTALQMARGEVRVFSDVSALGCQRFEGVLGTRYLVIPQNYSEVVGSRTFFDLVGVLGNFTIASIGAGSTTTAGEDFAENWEMRLRARERQLGGGIVKSEMPANFRVQAIEIGDRKNFKVFNKDDKFESVTAEVKYISARAVIWQDVDAPANGFTNTDFQTIGQSFDSPTYEVDVAAFGTPSDIDNNGKIDILLTPVVNELTPRGASGFVAGFFFGCDLQTSRAGCESNRSELFYLFVPDPTARFGDARAPSFVLNNILPVLAHEFQHMINFAVRQTQESLWLSEGMAHMAEDLVGDAFASRGQTSLAAQFRAQNYARGALYLRDSTSVSLLAEETPGTLQHRGGAWLMVKYLHAHYGGDALLRRMTQTQLSSVQNVTTSTSQPWSKLMSDWAVALYADDSPDLAGANVRTEYTFPNINLRTALISSGGTYALQPRAVGTSDFVMRGTLKASTQRHVLLDVPLSRTISLAMTGQRGGAFSVNSQPQFALMRIR